jgi:glycine cleavage system H protein
MRNRPGVEDDMTGEKENTNRGRQGESKTGGVTRRQFLEGAAMAAAGSALASLPLGCGQGGGTAQPGADSLPLSTASDTEPTNLIPITSPYIPPTAQPAGFKIPGTECLVATDRLYSADNLWVKQISNNRVVIGITSTMFHIINNPFRCSLAAAGTTMARGDTFGAIEGFKMAADLIAPVSGTVTETNRLVIGIVDTGDSFLSDFADPYNRGWMMVVQPAKPAELNGLMNANQYAKLVEGKGA